MVYFKGENPEEPAWIFAGTMVGLIFGIVGGSVLGFSTWVTLGNLGSREAA